MAATTGLAGFLTRVRHTLAPDARTDAELVREYLRSRSDAAFAELVRRFAPMVWCVCRRTVGHVQSAEDAFQAVFLVLARKAGTVRPAAAVGGWLHGVAVHTSLRARAMTDRRQTKHSPLDADHPAPPEAAVDPDDLRVLDEEIAKLPDHLRAAVALCELDGVSRKDAAARLGVAEGTLSSRLATARKQLAARLRARGVTLGSVIAALLGSGTATAVPPVATTASETVSALAEGAIRAMFLSKLKVLTAGSLAVLLLVIAGLLAVTPAAAKDQRRRNAPVPKAEKEGVILVGIQEDGQNRLELLTPKGEKVATIPLDPHPMYQLALSRDGKRVTVWAWDQFRTDRANRPVPGQKTTYDGTLLVYDVAKPDTPLVKMAKERFSGSVFAPDGESLYVNELADPDPAKAFRENAVCRIDLKTQKKEKIDLPADHMMADVSPDGKALLTISSKPNAKGEHLAMSYRVPLATLKPELLSDSAGYTRFSPDGGRVIGSKVSDPTDPSKREVTILNVKSGKESVVALEEDTYLIWGKAWSPDGKKVLVHRDVLLPGVKQPAPPPRPIPPGFVGEAPKRKPEVAIRNLDGSDPKPLADYKSIHIFGIDWR